MRAAAACDRDSAASIDANRPVCGAKGWRGAHGGGGDPGGTETYPFCSSTSLRPATCQTVPSRSPFSEYKQRAGYTELGPSIMSLPIYHSSSRDLRRFSFYMIHTIERLPPCSTKLHFSSLAPILFILLSSPFSLSVFHSPPSFASPLSLRPFLALWAASLHC